MLDVVNLFVVEKEERVILAVIDVRNDDRPSRNPAKLVPNALPFRKAGLIILLVFAFSAAYAGNRRTSHAIRSCPIWK